MRRGCRRSRRPGSVVIITGVVIILTLILPPGFWWFSLGAGLVALGVCLNRRCC